MKAEPATSASGLGTAASLDTEGQEGEAEGEEEYKLPPVCQEHVLNLATRMIVLVGDMAHKDEYQASHPPPFCPHGSPIFMFRASQPGHASAHDCRHVIFRFQKAFPFFVMASRRPKRYRMSCQQFCCL